MAKTNRTTLFLTLAEIVLACVVVGLIAGLVLCTAQLIEVARMRAQISQITNFDAAVESFYAKFDGMPGDLLAVSADRDGLPAGDGTPSHSDGDGKISPCNPGWQFNLGCETALFWPHLADAGFIEGDFNSDAALADERLKNASVTLAPYLPQSPIAEGIYITVWNTDSSQPSPRPRLPYGNYYEITRISGVYNEMIKEETGALTPTEASAIDDKIDDGMPLSGRVVVNGGTQWPDDVWGTFAMPGDTSCVSPTEHYNIHNYFISHRSICHVAIAMMCCRRHDN